MDGGRFLKFSLMLLAFFLFPAVLTAQNITTLTTTSASNNSSNNNIFPTCSAVQSATDPFPDTSTPIFRGNIDETLLPEAITKRLPADDNQFGVGISAGSNDFPLSISTPFSLDTFPSTPASGGGNNNTITQEINQITYEGNFAGGDQEFSILFSI